MFPVLLSILVVLSLASILVELVMRVRLTRREVPTEKLLWWRRGGDDVVEAYEELFPETHLPLLRRFAFWFIVVFAALILGSILWKST